MSGMSVVCGCVCVCVCGWVGVCGEVWGCVGWGGEVCVCGVCGSGGAWEVKDEGCR